MTIDTNIKALFFDFSRVLLFAKDPNYAGDLNPLNRTLLKQDKNYPFLEYFYLNTELLDYLKMLSNMRLIIFTSGTIQDAPAIHKNIDEVFEAVYSAEKMNVHKTEPDAYTQLCKELSLDPSEVLFIDDAQRNLDAARHAGLSTFLYKSNSLLFPLLDKTR